VGKGTDLWFFVRELKGKEVGPEPKGKLKGKQWVSGSIDMKVAKIRLAHRRNLGNPPHVPS
jgi:hypothetical protein